LSIMPVRDATSDDAAANYRPYVTGTAISFEAHPSTVAETARQIGEAQLRHAWLVHEDDGANLVRRTALTGHPNSGQVLHR
jgi:hypothetical protein